MSDQSTPDKAGGRLTRSTFVGFMWLVSGAGLEAVLKIVVLVILARLVTPAEFGLISAAMTLVALVEIFGRGGIAASIVQMRDITDRHIRTGHSLTLAFGAVAAAAFYLLRDEIASLYAMPDLGPILAVLSVLFVIRAAMLVSEALLLRRMRFRTLSLLSVASYVFGYAVVAITLSWAGFGVWALVWAQVAQACLHAAGLVLTARHTQIPLLDWQCVKQMGRFGFGVTLTNLGNYFATNADAFIVGRFLGAEALGYYSRAYVLLNQAAQIVGTVGDRVLYPALSSVQTDPSRMARGFDRAVGLVILTQLPATPILLVAAPEIILVMLGPQWGAAVLPFQILVAVLVFRTAYKFIGTALKAAGAVYIFAAWQWAYAVMVIGFSWLGLSYGLPGVAAGVSLSIVACYATGMVALYRVTGIGLRGPMPDFLRSTLVAVVLLGLLVAVRLGLERLAVEPLVMLLALVGVWGMVVVAILVLRPALLGSQAEWLAQTVAQRLAKLRKPQAKGPEKG